MLCVCWCNHFEGLVSELRVVVVAVALPAQPCVIRRGAQSIIRNVVVVAHCSTPLYVVLTKREGHSECVLRSPVCFDEAKNGELVLFACSHIICRGCYARLIRGPPASANCAHRKPKHPLLGTLTIGCISFVRSDVLPWHITCGSCLGVPEVGNFLAVAAHISRCMRWRCLAAPRSCFVASFTDG